jgi:hypothetical protein
MKIGNLGESLYELLKNSVGRMKEGFMVRKNIFLSSDNVAEVILEDNKYKINVSGDTAEIKLKNIHCVVPFFQWSNVDENYESIINSESNINKIIEKNIRKDLILQLG